MRAWMATARRRGFFGCIMETSEMPSLPSPQSKQTPSFDKNGCVSEFILNDQIAED
ncbi:hypothetical protein VM1G_11590 [Cytospora mali]|uniref:Uncharacterized protein n=1 Tax=Cytospora mali TaxID=578113 RepID=A0A194W063_CYTMA|nr:hypothetical protein VM1G_11590 [Valsa mali]